VVEPLYRQIYADLERKISTGEIRYMEQLPVLADLSSAYGVSDAPVRRALDELARAGFIVKRRGRGQGTFAIRRLTPLTVRVLLLARFDVSRSAPEMCHEVFDLITGIQQAACEAGCTLQQISSHSFAHLPPAGADTGYLVIAMTWPEYQQGVHMAQEHAAPYVLVNPPQAGHPCARVDSEHGSFLAVNYLAQLGHRRIAYVGESRSEWFTPRFQGYQRALIENGLPPDQTLVQNTNGIDASQDCEALDSLMGLPDPPTAIFACSDYRAIHLMTHCKRQGVRVAQDLSICGYDNIGESANIEPALTTVNHPRQELGAMALELLSSLHRGDTPNPIDRVVASQLVVRASCAPPKRQ
jgi:DNA-binding LacI/PurR family transcriptional regulator